MNDKDIQVIKEELAGIRTRLENVEGYFQNFDTTLNNHMNDYKAKLKDTQAAIAGLRGKLSWAFWVLFGLFVMALGGLIGMSVVLIQYLIERG